MITAVPASALRFIRCVTGTFEFGLNLLEVRRIHAQVTLREETAAATARIGWLTANGADIPVYDSAALFGLPAPSSRGAILTVAQGDAEIALAVDRVVRGSAVSDGELMEIPPILAMRAFPSALVAGDGASTLPVCDLARLALEPTPLRRTVRSVPDARLPRTSSGASARAGTPAGKLLVSAPFESPGGAPVRFALSFSQVLEVLAAPAVLESPGCAPGFAGLVHWRHRLIPVLDPAACFGLPLQSPQRYGRVLVLRNSSGAGLVALPAGPDTGTAGTQVALDSRSPLLDSLQHVRMAFDSSAGAMMILPDVDSILASPSLPQESLPA